MSKNQDPEATRCVGTVQAPVAHKGSATSIIFPRGYQRKCDSLAAFQGHNYSRQSQVKLLSSDWKSGQCVLLSPESGASLPSHW